MEKKIRELYNIYLELGHDAFEEKIKKPMELYLHASSNVVILNSFNTILANAIEKSKLGEASFYKNKTVINDCNKHAQTSESTISYKHVNFCGALRPCEKAHIEVENYCKQHKHEGTSMWNRSK